MPIEHLKKATKTASTGEDDTREIVQTMLREIEAGGEARVREYARELDNWDGDIVVARADIEAAAAALPARMKQDIEFAHARIARFAEAQLASLREFAVELSPGLHAGQRLVPVGVAGCYVPGGRYAHIASALMSVTTARVAGVRHVIACSPAQPGRGVHPAILFAAHLAGADSVLALGGVQGVAALAFGHFSGRPADILVGPGNRFVA
ncbi:MAG: histidinol dehydrogenase, partial [Gammaproteobacteria bacterium]